MKNFKLILISFGILSSSFNTNSQESPHLHTSPEWDECSFQLDPSLTQQEWHQFTREAGLAAYYRPLMDAEPIGVGKVDLSILQWQTTIDENEGAWNNTFVHPDSTHWLVGGPRLPIPGLTLRTGITKKLDVGFYWTTNPQANYSITGVQVQYNFLNNIEKGWSAASRLSFTTIYGPRDLTFATFGLDFVGSKKFRLYKDWISVTPYTNLSLILARAHERTTSIVLQDVNVFGFQGALGAVAQISIVRLATEYNFAAKNTFSFRLGFVFNFKSKK